MAVTIAVVVGAATPPGRLHRAAVAMVERLEAHRAAVTVVDLSAFRLESADGRADDAYDRPTLAAVEAIGGADAVVIASPVYRASIPGVLKNLLDLLPVAALENKPVAILAMGGSDHHYLGVDRHLRDILAWFGAVAAPTSVYLTGADFADGRPTRAALSHLDTLAATVITLAERLGGVALGPEPLAKKA